MKAVICINYPSQNHPTKYGDYLWNQDLGTLVYKGKVFDLDAEIGAFHATADKVFATADTLPKPTVRFLPGAPAPVAPAPAAVDLSTVPIADLVEGYRLRSREAKIFQLAQARAEKKARHDAVHPKVDDDAAEKSRMEGEGGRVPALAP